jgi:hypothetical protein
MTMIVRRRFFAMLVVAFATKTFVDVTARHKWMRIAYMAVNPRISSGNGLSFHFHP